MRYRLTRKGAFGRRTVETFRYDRHRATRTGEWIGDRGTVALHLSALRNHVRPGHELLRVKAPGMTR